MMDSNKQHVLHVRVVSGHGGGPDKTILRSPRYVDATRYPMTCAYLYPKGDPGIKTLQRTAEQFGSPLIAIDERSAIDFRAVAELLQLCRDKQVAIWHGHDYKSDVLGLILRRLHSMKLVTTAHGFTRESMRTKLYYHVDNLAMRYYDHVIAVSPPLVEHCRKIGISSDKLTYIPNAIEPASYSFTQRLTRGCRIGVIGRFSTEKGVDRAIHVLSQMPRDTQLHLIGDGPQREALQTLAHQRGVSESITWHGWQSDVKPFYDKFDVLLLPSHTEGLPNVALEAMALGVKVVATDVGGVRELLDDGRLGTVLDPCDTQHWAKQIDDALTAPHDAAAARQWVEKRYSFTARMKRITAIYDQLTQPNALRQAA